MADRALIDQCYMWCVHKGLEPINVQRYAPETQALFRMAVRDYVGGFRELNVEQRRRIAGMATE